jgi:hypothetical protein
VGREKSEKIAQNLVNEAETESVIFGRRDGAFDLPKKQGKPLIWLTNRKKLSAQGG